MFNRFHSYVYYSIDGNMESYSYLFFFQPTLSSWEPASIAEIGSRLLHPILVTLSRSNLRDTRIPNFTREHVPRSIRCFTTVTKLQRNYRREMVIADWSGYGQKSIEAHVSRRSERPAELSARIYGNGRSLFFVHLFQLLFHPASRARSFQSC